MSLYLIIDGYNLIRQSAELLQYEKKDLTLGREMLLKKLLTYQRLKKHAITVVFDGWHEGHFSEGHDRVGSIKVIFSRRGEKADEVIKRLASQKKGETVVVTSDRVLGYSCYQKGCEVIPATEFLAKMELAAYIEQKGKIEEDENTPYQKQKGTKKKGPSRRLPRSQRRHHAVLKKL